MLKNQPLPIPFEYLLTTGTRKNKSAPGLPRFHQQMHLRIMPERFIMSDSLNRPSERFPIQDPSRTELYRYVKALRDQPLKHFNLNFSHELHMDLRKPIVKADVKQRFLLLKLGKKRHKLCRCHVVRQDQPIGQHRNKERPHSRRLSAQPFSRRSSAQPRNRTDLSCLNKRRSLVTCTRIQPDLIHFLTVRRFSVLICHKIAYR